MNHNAQKREETDDGRIYELTPQVVAHLGIEFIEQV